MEEMNTAAWQQFHPSRMINVLGWILSCAESGLREAEQSQREWWHRATFPALWSWASQEQDWLAARFKATLEVFWTEQF